MDTESIRRTITPLRLVFWGALICVIDVTITSGSFKFDILNDLVGALLIAVGVFRLADIRVSERYKGLMRFVQFGAVFAIVSAAMDFISLPHSIAFGVLGSLVSLITLAATIVFCVAMRCFCDEASLARSSRSWRVTTILFVVIYAIPVGLFYVLGLVALASSGSLNYRLNSPLALLIVPVFLIPLIHLFVSTSRMKRDAGSAGPQDGPPTTASGPVG